LKKSKKIDVCIDSGVYPSDHAVGEADEVRPLDIYGLSKLAGEQWYKVPP
jgi:dTDP-4-dehydrorhamnose reductase